MTDAELQADAVRMYEEARSRLDLAVAAWKAAGSPLTITHPNGIEAEHPLLKVVQTTEMHARRLGDAPVLRRAHRGPAPSAVVQPDVGHSPATKLRAVG